MTSKLAILALLLFGSVCFSGGEAAAQGPARINFEKGKNSAVVAGSTGRFGANYVVKARAGQKTILSLKPATGAGIKVETTWSYGQMVLLEETKGGRYEIGVEETSDLNLFVGSTNGRPARFTLELRVLKLKDI